jgi:catechol 2,3-dioxygenase-like lactoylglutathione lyase family enzyme/transcriptional regulator with XRE-family HTH domain
MIGREGIVGIHHVNFTVEDLDRTVDFYTTLLGFELRSRGIYEGDIGIGTALLGDLHREETHHGIKTEIAALELTGLRVEFMQWLRPKSAPYHHDLSIAGSAHLGIRVKNIAEVRKRLQEAGVTFRSPTEHVFPEVGHLPWQMCVFQDPDGITIELIQEQPVTDLVKKLGIRIREARLARGLTLRQTASMSEISTAHLSQVERGDAIPSLPALVGISATLGVAPEYFLRMDSDAWEDALAQQGTEGRPEPSRRKRGKGIVTANSRRMRSVGGEIAWDWLTDSEAPVRVFRTSYDVGAFSEDLGVGETGSEICIVLEGALQVELESISQVLEAGASITYDRSGWRRFCNAGDVPAVAVWVITDTNHAHGWSGSPSAT